MKNFQTVRIRAGAIAAVLGVSVLVAACGGSSSSGGSSASTPASSGASTSKATATATSAKGVSIVTASGKHGTYLAGAGGRALYLWEGDKGGMSNCSGACAQVWPPLTTKSKPIAGSGVTASKLGTVKRSDGTLQVTYSGHPLYYFAEDSGPGTTLGQASDGFGADWWIVAPSGAAITSADHQSGSSSSGG